MLRDGIHLRAVICLEVIAYDVRLGAHAMADVLAWLVVHQPINDRRLVEQRFRHRRVGNFAFVSVEIQPGSNVIYLTAYSEYAVPAWTTGASGYMLKPITVEGVQAQLDRKSVV